MYIVTKCINRKEISDVYKRQVLLRALSVYQK